MLVGDHEQCNTAYSNSILWRILGVTIAAIYTLDLLLLKYMHGLYL